MTVSSMTKTTHRDASSGGLTGATGDLTPDTIQADFDPGERREVEDPEQQASVTQAQGLSPRDPAYRLEARPAPVTDAGVEGREANLGGDRRADEDHY